MMKPSITCVNIFGFLDFTDDLVDMTAFSSDFFSWFEITLELLVLSEITLTGFDLSCGGSFAVVGEVLMWSGCMGIAVIVVKQSVTAVVDATATTVVTVGAEMEVMADTAMDDMVVFALALTTAVTEPVDNCCGAID